MAIRFVSFEFYRDTLLHFSQSSATPTSLQFQPTTATFLAGLASGITEAVLIVTPAEVCKIRMQSQHHSLMDATQMAKRKYTNVVQTAGVIVKEEGFGALYKGIVPTMLRQGCNQAANFTAYGWAKKKLLDMQSQKDGFPKGELAPWQHLLLGGLSGGVGPSINNPLDVVKTRLQRQVVLPGHIPKYTGLLQACSVIAKEEGVKALWKGLTPRLMRIMPGQAITFMTYEAVSKQLNKYGIIPTN